LFALFDISYLKREVSRYRREGWIWERCTLLKIDGLCDVDFEKREEVARFLNKSCV